MNGLGGLSIWTAARGAFALAVSLALSVPAPAADESPNAQLARLGLLRDRAFWIVPEEKDLRERLDQAPKLERDFHAAAKKRDEALAANNKAWTQLTRVKAEMDRLAALLDSGNLNPVQRRQVALEHDRRVAVYNKFGPHIYDAGTRNENPPLTAAEVEFVNAHSALCLTLLAIERDVKAMESEYAKFKADLRVTAALQALGSANRLGPAQNYAAQLKRYTRLADQMMGDDVPVYLANLHFHVSAIVNERTPVTFIYMPEGKITMLADSVARLAGVVVPENTERVQINLGDERQVMARVARIATLRLGKHVVTDVETFVLSPDASDIPSRLGTDALQSFQINFEPQSLRMRLRPQPKKPSP